MTPIFWFKALAVIVFLLHVASLCSYATQERGDFEEKSKFVIVGTLAPWAFLIAPEEYEDGKGRWLSYIYFLLCVCLLVRGFLV